MVWEIVQPGVQQRRWESKSFKVISGGGHAPCIYMSCGSGRPLCAALLRDASSDRSRQFDETGAVGRVNERSRRSILLRAWRALMYCKHSGMKTAAISTFGVVWPNYSSCSWAVIVKCGLALGDVLTVDIPSPHPLSGNIYMFAPCLLEQNPERWDLDFMNKKATSNNEWNYSNIIKAMQLLHTEDSNQDFEILRLYESKSPYLSWTSSKN